MYKVDPSLVLHSALLEELNVQDRPSGPQLLKMLRRLDVEHSRGAGGGAGRDNIDVAERAVVVLRQLSADPLLLNPQFLNEVLCLLLHSQYVVHKDVVRSLSVSS
jgi:hypothetical protein